MKWIVSALLLLSLAGCGSMGFKKPQVSLSNVEPGKSTLFEQNFTVTLRIANPNPVPLNASGLDFELMLGGDKLGNGNSAQAISIPANGEGLVPLQVHTSLAAWIRQLANWQQLPGGKLEYQIRGELKDLNGLATLPFDNRGEWKLPQIGK
ncbi:LEA type 2 family protein [Chromobacterium sp. IIBBL 290-4]|uniref:LEA type 2 family protein n=1 Tax=Chromobacterium sp. IIBBL 290-4 TaxID=2953890 RepID=UPI0020B733B7|nr:LEA type 2 family protein [Chromobacterium sp. IIBBL 290-4]UTH74975.1 LEA type 2 family protein [Chromobacterium sp. IIBBL 290-4]